MSTLFTRTRTPLVSGRGPLSNAPGNLAAPAIVQPPAALAWDYASAEGGAKLQWPLTNNQFDGLVVHTGDGAQRDWAATLSGTQERYGGVRYYYAWTNIDYQDLGEGPTLGYPDWQPAFREVYRVTRKGSSGQAARTLVFECMHNTLSIPAGDTVWFYMSTDWSGGVDPARSVNVGGFNLPLLGKLTCSGSTGSTGSWSSHSFVEVTFDQDLPAVDWWSPTYVWEDWLAPLPKLTLVHHSFYADARNKVLRYPYSWHYYVLRDEVLGNGGHLILGGYQGKPVWRDWTHLFNWMGDLAVELYRMEKEALADFFGATDPRFVLEEMENEPVVDWLDNMSEDKPLGTRRAIKEIMYPTSRTAWGPERSFLIKGTSFGSINSIRDEWDFDNDRDFGGGNNFVGNHNYDDQAKYPDGRNLWYGAREDCDYHAGLLIDAVNRGKFKGGVMSEWGVPNWVADPERGQKHGRLHTAMAAAGIPMAYWDLTGDHYGCAWLYTDVPGKEGKKVQAIIPEMRPYTGRAGRTA